MNGNRYRAGAGRLLASLAIFALAPAGAHAAPDNAHYYIRPDIGPGRGPLNPGGVPANSSPEAMAAAIDCRVFWNTASPEAVRPDSVLFLGEKHLGEVHAYPPAPGTPAPRGGLIVQPVPGPGCAAHVLLGLRLPGLSGKLELSEIRPSPSAQPQRKCTFQSEDGPIMDAQAAGFCVFGPGDWQIRAAGPAASAVGRENHIFK